MWCFFFLSFVLFPRFSLFLLVIRQFVTLEVVNVDFYFGQF